MLEKTWWNRVLSPHHCGNLHPNAGRLPARKHGGNVHLHPLVWAKGDDKNQTTRDESPSAVPFGSKPTALGFVLLLAAGLDRWADQWRRQALRFSSSSGLFFPPLGPRWLHVYLGDNQSRLRAILWIYGVFLGGRRAGGVVVGAEWGCEPVEGDDDPHTEVPYPPDTTSSSSSSSSSPLVMLGRNISIGAASKERKLPMRKLFRKPLEAVVYSLSHTHRLPLY